MSEKVTLSPETGKFEALETASVERPKAAEYSKAEQETKVESAQAAVAAESTSSERPTMPYVAVDERPHLIDHAIKSLRMRQNLRQIQAKLSPGERGFSKIVHQPGVQKVSEAASKTVARPSGILGGGILAFVGTLLYQLLTRYYGLPYNFSFFVLFFVGGFALGLFIEYSLRKMRKLNAR